MQQKVSVASPSQPATCGLLRRGFARLALPFQTWLVAFIKGLPEFHLRGLVNPEQPARVAVTVHGDPRVRLLRLGRLEKTRTLTADDFRHGPVRPIGIDDPEIAVLAYSKAAGIPPAENTVCARLDHHAVEVRVVTALESELFRVGGHAVHIPGIVTHFSPYERLFPVNHSPAGGG